MGVAFGHLRQIVRRRRPLPRRGFTLVEILVVVGIIVVLATMLLPVLNNVRESARRTNCASNLREIGKAARAFAKDHDGYLPMCYRMRDVGAGFPYYVPFAISQGQKQFGAADIFSNDSNPNLWRVFGTSWVAWQQYGGNIGIFSCPSASGAVLANLSTSYPEYGDVVWTDYMYLGGLSVNALKRYPGSLTDYSLYSVDHWGTAVPAVTADAGSGQQGGRSVDNSGNVTNIAVQTTTSVLAADMVFFSGGPGYGWDLTAGRYRINHVQQGNYKMPDFQNVLYSDGSVAAHGREDYFQPLNADAKLSTGNGTPLDTGPNWSMELSNTAGGYLYWGELEALPLPIPPPQPPPTQPGGGWGSPPIPPPDPLLPPPPPQPPGAVPMVPVYIK